MPPTPGLGQIPFKYEGKISEEERDLSKFNSPGQLIIINNIGADKLEDTLKAKFNDLKFKSDVSHTCKELRTLRTDLYKTVDDISKNTSQPGSIVVIVISYQDADGRLQGKEETYTLNEITTPFLKLNINIPKIFLFYIKRREDESTTYLLPLPAIKEPNCIVCVSPYEGYFQKLTQHILQWKDKDLDFTSFLCKINGDENLSAPGSNLPILTSSQQKRIILGAKKGNQSGNIELFTNCYDLSNSERPGLAVIINCKHFSNDETDRYLKTRHGSAVNISQLIKTYDKLNFETNVYTDVSRDHYLNILGKIAEMDFSSYGCLIMNVMTHSDGNELYCSDGAACRVSETWERIKCNVSLNGKPKIFFFQAPAYNLEVEELSTGDHQDMVISYACLKDEQPLRSNVHGSFFTSHVSEVMAKWRNQGSTLITSLIEINRGVGNQKIREGKEIYSPFSQNPCFISLLTKDVKYSVPNIESSPVVNNESSITVEDDLGEQEPLTPTEEASTNNDRTTDIIRDTGKFKIPGQLIIINNVGDKKLECDLEQWFANCGFQISSLIDFESVNDIKNRLLTTTEYITRNRDELGCIVVVIISRVDVKGQFLAKDETYNFIDMISPFANEQLQQIPKIFLSYVYQSADRSKIDIQKEFSYPVNVCCYISPYEGSFGNLIEMLKHHELRYFKVIHLLTKILSLASKETPFMPCLTSTLTTHVLLRGWRHHMFGLLEMADGIVKACFKDAIEKDDADDFQLQLQKYCRYNMDNIKFLAKPMLHLIMEHDRPNILKMLLEYYLPQDEIMKFVFKIISEPVWKAELLKTVVNHYKSTKNINILRFHFSQDRTNIETISGFPILCVLKNAVQKKETDYEKVKQKISTLLELGANINDHYAQDKEVTPVHYAAEQGMRVLVQYFVNERGANIDVQFDSKTARNIINEKNILSVHGIKTQTSTSTSDKNKLLFKCLYERNEKKFIDHFSDKTYQLDENIHDGKYTLLQLAIKYNLKKVTQELFNYGVDRSAMAGYCKPPILIALEHSKFECLQLLAQDTSKLDLRFCSNNATFLHHLANHCDVAHVGHSYENIQDEIKSTLTLLLTASIKQNIHLSALDESENTALKICVKNKNILLNILLDNGGFLNIDETIAEKLQPSFLDKYLGSKVQYNSDNIELDFKFLKPIDHCDNDTGSEIIAPVMDPFSELCQFEKFNEALANSTIVTYLLSRKWHQFSFVYTVNLILTFVFIVCFSTLVFTKINYPQKKTVGVIFLCVNFVLCFLLAVKEFLQYWVVSFQHYIRNLENYVEIALIVSALASQIIMIVTDDFKVFQVATSTAVTLAYIELTLLIGRHPLTEIYIRMFKKVLLNTLALLLIFASFIFAFAFGFHILFLKRQDLTKVDNLTSKNESNSADINELDKDQNYFNNIGYAIMKTSAMLLGEFDLANINFALSAFNSEIFFMIFLILIPIVLVNVLNALAISDTKRIIDEANVRCSVSNIKLYTKLERVLLKTSKINLNERCYGLDTQKIKRENIINKIVLPICEYFNVIKSQIIPNDYKLKIEFPKNRKLTFKNLINLHARYTLKTREISIAYQLAKANLGKHINTNKNDASNLNQNIININRVLDFHSNEIKCIRNDLEKTRKEFNQKLNDNNEELKRIADCLQVLVSSVNSLQMTPTESLVVAPTEETI